MNIVDPYRILAGHIVMTQPSVVLKKIVAGDKKPIIDMLRAECRMLDWQGPIIDTMFADLHTVQDSMWLRRHIEDFAFVLIERFDFNRLIEEIKYLCPDL